MPASNNFGRHTVKTEHGSCIGKAVTWFRIFQWCIGIKCLWFEGYWCKFILCFLLYWEILVHILCHKLYPSLLTCVMSYNCKYIRLLGIRLRDLQWTKLIYLWEGELCLVMFCLEGLYTIMNWKTTVCDRRDIAFNLLTNGC